MNRILAIVFMAGGLLVLIWRISSGHTVSAEAARLITASPHDITGWLVVLGVISAISGAILGMRSSNRKREN